MWVCVVSDPSKLWMDALIVALYWVFHCRLAAKRLWVWSPGSPGGSEVVFPPAPLGSGGVALASFALLAFPLGTNCTQPWPLCSLLGSPGLQRAEQGAKCHVNREQSTDWGQEMNSCPSRKASAQVLGEFLYFQLLRIRQLMKRCHGRTKRCKRFLCSLGRRQSSKGAGRSWNSLLCLGADGRHCQGQQTPAEQWMEGWPRQLPSNNHRLAFNITAVHGLMLTAQVTISSTNIITSFNS